MLTSSSSTDTVEELLIERKDSASSSESVADLFRMSRGVERIRMVQARPRLFSLRGRVLVRCLYARLYKRNHARKRGGASAREPRGKEVRTI